MPNVILELDLTGVRAEAASLPETVRALRIEDTASFAAGTAILARITAARTRIAALLKPHIARAFDAHRALVADRQRLDGPLADAEAVLKHHLAAYTVAEEARRMQEARAQTIAADQARTTALWAEVEDLEAAGYTQEAADLVEDAMRKGSAPLVVLPPPVVTDGLRRRDRWRYEVTDPALVPREYLTIDHTKLGGVVRALKGATQIPGVRVWAEHTVAVAKR